MIGYIIVLFTGMVIGACLGVITISLLTISKVEDLEIEARRLQAQLEVIDEDWSDEQNENGCMCALRKEV